VDLVSVQVIDVFIALPGLVLALMITAIVGASVANLCIILGIVAWPEVARLVRGQVLGLRETAFIQAAEALGGSPPWIVWTHLWPNIMAVVAAQFSIAVSAAILTSASLSFLGLGIAPPTPDWGAMVRGGFDYLAINPMMSLAPGASVGLVAVGFYLLGSAVD
jgi:peptide/nickel transport system permease protein